VHYAIEVALHNKNWNAALAMLSHIKLEQIERDLRLDDDSILDGIKVKEMPKELKKLCKAAIATVDMEVNESDEKVCRALQTWSLLNWIRLLVVLLITFTCEIKAVSTT
jgi:hypothetical protein